VGLKAPGVVAEDGRVRVAATRSMWISCPASRRRRRLESSAAHPGVVGENGAAAGSFLLQAFEEERLVGGQGPVPGVLRPPVWRKSIVWMTAGAGPTEAANIIVVSMIDVSSAGSRVPPRPR